RELNLTSMIQHVADDADYEASSTNRTIKISRSDECRVVGSEELIQRAVESVLRNAVRYTREWTQVDVSHTSQNGNADVRIKDHGGGVPTEELENLFRPFYRVGEARDRGSGGTGLGLAIAEQAIIAHDGNIAARNDADGPVVDIKFACKGAGG